MTTSHNEKYVCELPAEDSTKEQEDEEYTVSKAIFFFILGTKFSISVFELNLHILQFAWNGSLNVKVQSWGFLRGLQNFEENLVLTFTFQRQTFGYPKNMFDPSIQR